MRRKYRKQLLNKDKRILMELLNSGVRIQIVWSL